MDYPGIGRQTFTIKADRGNYPEGSIIHSGLSSVPLTVIRAHAPKWWQRWLGAVVRFLYAEDLKCAQYYMIVKPISK